MIDKDKIPKRNGFYWAKVSIGYGDEFELQPVELVLAMNEPRVYLIGCEANSLGVIMEFVAPLDLVVPVISKDKS